MAEAGNREQGKQYDGNGERSQPTERSALCRDAERKNEESADPPRIKRYRIYRKGPDKIRSDEKEYGKGVYDICMKDLKKHAGRPPGAAGSERASASGPRRTTDRPSSRFRGLCARHLKAARIKYIVGGM